MSDTTCPTIIVEPPPLGGVPVEASVDGGLTWRVVCHTSSWRVAYEVTRYWARRGVPMRYSDPTVARLVDRLPLAQPLPEACDE